MIYLNNYFKIETNTFRTQKGQNITKNYSKTKRKKKSHQHSNFLSPISITEKKYLKNLKHTKIKMRLQPSNNQLLQQLVDDRSRMY